MVSAKRLVLAVAYYRLDDGFLQGGIAGTDLKEKAGMEPAIVQHKTGHKITQ